TPHGVLSRQVTFRVQQTMVANKHVFSLVVPTAAVGEVALNGSPINPTLFQGYTGGGLAHATLEVPQGLHQVSSAHGFQVYTISLGQGESMATAVQSIGGTTVVQDSVVCAGGSITLQVPEPMINIEWTAASAPGTVLGTGPSITVTPTASESYIVAGIATLT